MEAYEAKARLVSKFTYETHELRGRMYIVSSIEIDRILNGHVGVRTLRFGGDKVASLHETNLV